MKKTLCIILILSILSLSACNVAEPIDIPEKVESPSESSPESPSTPIEESTPTPEKTEAEVDAAETPNETTNSDAKESTTTVGDWVDPLFSTGDYNEYLDFLSTEKVKIPDDFITYEMIENIGTFKCFVAMSFNSYTYLMIDSNEMWVSVTISSNLNSFSTTTMVVPGNTNDLRKVTALNNQRSAFVHNNLLYNYYESGRLYRISWQFSGKTILLNMTNNMRLADYPLDGETTFVSQLLSTQTATAAVQSFNQNIEAEIAKNIANKQLES